MDKLNAMNPGKSTGVDRLHPYFLCSLADILCTPLKILFNKSLREGVVPSQWLEACITAIHKKGLMSAVGNCHPVSITSVVCKMMESIIHDHIVAYMSSNNFFENKQHGFVPNRDCMTNLLSALEVGWSLNWQLPFNVEKCKIICIGNDKNPQTYYMNEQPLIM